MWTLEKRYANEDTPVNDMVENADAVMHNKSENSTLKIDQLNLLNVLNSEIRKYSLFEKITFVAEEV